MGGDRRRYGLWLLIASASLYVLYIGGGWWGIYLPQLRVVTVAIAAVALLAWLVAARRHAAWGPRTRLAPAFVAAVASLGLSTLFSTDQRVSAEYFAYSAVLVALYLLLVRLLADPFFRSRLVALMALAFAVTSIAYVALVVSHWMTWWSVIGRLVVPPLRPEFESLTYGNPSAVLTLVALLGVPAAAVASRSRRFGSAGPVVVALLVGLVALLTGSRAGWLALGAAGICVGVAWTRFPGHRTMLGEAARGLWRGRIRRILVTVGSIVVLGAVVVLAPTLLRRLLEGGEDLRASYIAVALRLFGTAPVFGTGPGTWVIDRIAFTQAGETDYYIPHAHDVPAQTLAELGIVGALAGIGVLANLVTLLRSALRDGDSSRRWWGWLTFLGLLYVAFHQLLDFYANMPAILIAAAFPVAYLDATSALGDDRGLTRQRATLVTMPGSWARRATSTLAVALILACCAALLAQELPAMSSDQAVAFANQGRWSDALGPANAAKSGDPDVAPYQLTAGLAAAHAGDHAAAITAFADVAARTDLPEAWLNLAAEQALADQADQAASSIARSLRLGIQRPAIALAAGDLALRIGDGADAERALTAGLLEAPSFAGDPWWTSGPQSAVFPTVLQDAMAGGTSPLQWQLALEHGDVNLAASLAPAAAAQGGIDAPAITEAWSGDTRAFASLVSGCRADPYNLLALAWCGRLENRAGDLETGSGFLYLADAVIGGAAAAGYAVRVDHAATGRSLAGDPAIFWGTYTYRRFTPWDVLDPSLLHLRLE